MSSERYTHRELGNIFSKIVICGVHDRTYKFAFARFLLEYCKAHAEDPAKAHVDYSTIAEYFLEYYWPLCNLGIKHSAPNTDPRIITIIKKLFTASDRGLPLANIRKSDPDKFQDCIDKITKACFHDVTWRFQKIKDSKTEITPFFEYNTKRTINNNRKEMDLKSGIELNRKAILFFKTNYESLMVTVIQEWIRFLRDKNKPLNTGLHSKPSFYDMLHKSGSLKLPINRASLRMHVWDSLNSIGRTIPFIQSTEKYRQYDGTADNQEYRNRSIWHTKSEIDAVVADRLGIDLCIYDYKKNPFYMAVVNEIGRLREKNILIDWDTSGSKEMGVGIWRLDKTKLAELAYDEAKLEMHDGNFYSAGDLRMIMTREKQRVFRNYLLKDYDRCALCGFTVHDYMIGAHIVPYRTMRVYDPENSMNPRNGMLLCRLCDAAFETGAIRVAQNFDVEIGKSLTNETGVAVRSWIGNIVQKVDVREGMKYPPEPHYFKMKTTDLEKSGGLLCI